MHVNADEIFIIIPRPFNGIHPNDDSAVNGIDNKKRVFYNIYVTETIGRQSGRHNLYEVLRAGLKGF